jgi:hypothetical protein
MTWAFADASKRFRRWSLLLESLPTKTSFGPDGNKQISRLTNDLQKLFLERARLSALSHLKGFMIQYSTFYEFQLPEN